MTKEEMKDRIRMALKDPVLFDLICENIVDLEKENAKLKTDYEVLSCSVGDFDELQNKLEEQQRKNNGLSDNLTNAKEIISEYINILKGDTKNWKKTQEKAEQFLSEVE